MGRRAIGVILTAIAVGGTWVAVSARQGGADTLEISISAKRSI